MDARQISGNARLRIRDDLRELQSEIEDGEQIASDAYSYLEQAIEGLSQIV